MFKTNFSERDINTQLPLGRYKSRVDPFAVVFTNKCSYCNTGTLRILIDILDPKGVPTDNAWLSFQHLSIFQWGAFLTKVCMLNTQQDQ